MAEHKLLDYKDVEKRFAQIKPLRYPRWLLATPLDHLLVETDAPYLTPVPYRGQRNEPGFTRFTVEKIAELRKKSPEDVARATYENASRLFLNH